MTRKLKAAIIGSGNIGTDLMIKILRQGRHVEMGAMVGIDPASDGLARAQRLGVATTAEGVEGLARLPVFDDIDLVFDATSAAAHVRNDAFLRGLKPGIRMIDLTPAAIGPYCVPPVNLKELVGKYYKTSLENARIAQGKQPAIVDARSQTDFILERTNSVMEMGYIKKKPGRDAIDWTLLEEVIKENPDLYAKLKYKSA